MAKVDIPFVGIHRETNEALCKDGECMKLMNMTATKEGLKVLPHLGTGTTLSLGQCVTAKKIVSHSLSGKYIIIGSDNKVYKADEDFTNASPIYTSTDAKDFETLGNVVCLMTTNGLKYLIWNGTEFVNCGSKPDYPRLLIDDVETKLYRDFITGLTLTGIGTASLVEGSTADITAKAYGANLLYKLRANAFEDGRFIDRAFFRVGYRMFDGTYLAMSPIYTIEANTPVCRRHIFARYPEQDQIEVVFAANKDEYNFFSGYVPSAQDRYTAYAVLAAFLPKMRLKVPSLANWKQFIAGIDIFTTGSIERHEHATELNDYGNVVEYWKYLDDTEYTKKVENNLVFRLYKSYDIDLNETWSVNGTDPDSIQVQEALDYFTSSSEFVATDATKTCVYNSRLHIANFDEVLSNPYTPFDYFSIDGAQKEAWFSKITLSNSSGTCYRYPISDSITGMKSTDNIKTYNHNHSQNPQLIKYAWITGNNIKLWYTQLNTATYGKTGSAQQVMEIPVSHSVYGLLAPCTTGSVSPFGSDTAFSYEISPTLTERTITQYNEYGSGAASADDAPTAAQQSTRDNALKASFAIAVDLTTSDGNKEVTLSSIDVPNRYEVRTTAVVICHPDSRATAMYLKYTGDTIGHIKLKSDIGSNTAISFANFDFPSGSMTFTQNNVLHRENILKVSAIDNPIAFPPSQTYAPNNSPITGLAVNNEALSESQHGENPLYVFTETGIKAMVVDRTGSMVYPAIDDVSNDELSGSMTSIEDGVIFASGTGLKLIRGKRVTNISKAMEGEDSVIANGVEAALGATVDVTGSLSSNVTNAVPRLLKKSPISYTKYYQVNFAKYIQGAILGYQYLSRLLYVSNPAYNYSYVYNLESGEWSQCDDVPDGFVGGTSKFLGMFAVGTATVIRDFNIDWSNVTFDRENIVNRDIYIVSRPIKFGDLNIKKVEQYMLNGFIRPKYNSTGEHTIEGGNYDTSSNTILQMTLLGSLDGLTYQVCGHIAAERPVNYLVSQLYRTNGYRFFIVVITAKEIMSNTILNGLTFEVGSALSARMR